MGVHGLLGSSNKARKRLECIFEEMRDRAFGVPQPQFVRRERQPEDQGFAKKQRSDHGDRIDVARDQQRNAQRRRKVILRDVDLVGEDERAQDCYRALTDELLARGYPPYRLNISSMHYVAADGPYAETAEAIGGFYVLWADSVDDAVDVARAIPVGASGGIELRPVMEFS